MNSGPPRCRWPASSIASQSTSSGPVGARWRRRRGTPGASRRGGSAARSPTSATSSRRTSSERVDAVALEQRHEHVAERVGPDRAGASARRRRAWPARARCRPPLPAAVMRISSTSAPPWPSGIASTGRTSTSRTCTPMQTIALHRAGLVRPVAASTRRRRPRASRCVARRAPAARRSPRRASTRVAAHSSSSVARTAPARSAP